MSRILRTDRGMPLGHGSLGRASSSRAIRYHSCTRAPTQVPSDRLEIVLSMLRKESREGACDMGQTGANHVHVTLPRPRRVVPCWRVGGPNIPRTQDMGGTTLRWRDWRDWLFMFMWWGRNVSGMTGM